MDRKAGLARVVVRRAVGLLLSFRGMVAVCFMAFIVLAGAYFLDAFTQAGTVIGELVKIFEGHPEFEFGWLFFDGTLTKLVTLFVAPIFAFDAVSGDRSGERLGLLLSRPLSRSQYMLVNLASSTLAFGTVFFAVMLPGYVLISPGVPELAAGAYVATCALMFLLGFFAICFALMVSTLVKSNLVSFVATFGSMAVLMTPNAMKYTSDGLMELAKATPHYYATYFTTHAVEPGLYALCAVIIVVFSLPFLALAVLKLQREDL